MSELSYLSVIERYHEYGGAIQELLASIVTGVGDQKLCAERDALRNAIRNLADHYPFVDMIYLLDGDGQQISPILGKDGKEIPGYHEVGTDRSQRPYFRLVKQAQSGIAVSRPYFSNIGRHLCISAIARCGGDKNAYVVVDIDLREIIEFLMGDTLRGRFNPLFKVVYTMISMGLFAIVAVLLFAAFTEELKLFAGMQTGEQLYLKPFSVIIFLTLALAVFDLGKTTIEEEVLMHKDIFRHSSTRRTITRFMAAILIAVSIESLLLMFKAALGDGRNLQDAVWMMFSAVGLLVGLGVYVYLGSRAEVHLKSMYGMHSSMEGD